MTTRTRSGPDSNRTAPLTASARSVHSAVAIGLLIATAGFALLAGVSGLLVGVALVIAWYALDLAPIHVVALGHIALAVFAPPSLVSFGLAVTEVGFGIGLFAPAAIESDRPQTFVAAALVATIGLVMIVWLAQRWESWIAASALTVGVALTGYTLYRYESVRLGLAEGSA